MNMSDALASAARKARRETSREAFTRLDALSRTRALTNAETNALARAIKIIDQVGDNPAVIGWTAKKDEQLLGLRAAGTTFPDIAKAMGTTKASVRNRYDRLRAKGVIA